MGRGRKGKKQPVVASREDGGSGEEEKIPAHKRRGRPQKPLKDEIEEEEEERVENIEEDEDGENAKGGSLGIKDVKNQAATENGRKRKRTSQAKENTVKEENGVVGTKLNTEEPLKPVVGFRQNGSRRKNKPRRAAEAGVQCK